MSFEEAKKRYTELYIERVINGDGSSNDEMSELFAIILEGFNDSNVKMDEFIQSIIDRNTVKEPTELEKLQLENQELKQSIMMNESTILELADMILSR